MPEALLHSYEKLLALNLDAARSLLGESLAAFEALAAARSADDLLAAQTTLLRPLSEGQMAYADALRDIASQAGAEWNGVAQAQAAQMQQAFEQGLDALTRNAPPGSEPFVAVFKQSVGLGLQLIEATRATARTR